MHPKLRMQVLPRAPFPQTCHLKKGPYQSECGYSAEPSSIQSPLSLSPELKSALEKFVQEHNVVLFMKGTKQFPQVCVLIANPECTGSSATPYLTCYIQLQQCCV